jgi:hypothetical protein
VIADYDPADAPPAAREQLGHTGSCANRIRMVTLSSPEQ